MKGSRDVNECVANPWWVGDRGAWTFAYLNVGLMLVAMGEWCLNKWVVKPMYVWEDGVVGMVVHGYANDFFAGLFLLGYTNVLVMWMGRRTWAVSRWWQVGLMMLMVGLFWEGVTPMYWQRSTGDVFDLLMYLLGGGVYIGLVKVCGLWVGGNKERS
ncbi:hypothetical protein [Poriferisphaera sp. WC338]|uniref:hypothetical protein n=1 Tax=Poriferisphaera sp. WC338 TaxID=3425129 RepID=UPI003D81456E